MHGRARIGARSKAKAPFGHWGTQTSIASLRCDGLTAPWVVDKPLNRATFEIYVETLLSPTVKPGNVVILDNLASHKSDLKERGAWFLFLPPYSPHVSAPAPSTRSGEPLMTSAASTHQQNAASYRCEYLLPTSTTNVLDNNLDDPRHGTRPIGVAVSSTPSRVHGGSIGVDSQRGAGNSFWFSDPCTRNPPPKNRPVNIGPHARILVEFKAAPSPSARLIRGNTATAGRRPSAMNGGPHFSPYSVLLCIPRKAPMRFE